MSDTVTIPREEYERLLAIAEDAKDIADADRIVAAVSSGDEETIPAEYVNRMVDGESPLRVFRDLRGFTQAHLAELSGVNRVMIANIEAGKRSGSIETMKRLATALSLTVDDLI
ncbi:helix-turn-helix transcriptional regulator [Acuticoccus sp. M5D2P5]|uniref:helix-turn-helix transcriptional regulator n=1 Tax=Acuticoccus kalidii TaxID=2910977 RepID=UPI001F3341A3|nr:helix-turn-helix transcriptional regulator [Acuticoccus kalidii]MCF3935025.1 helix-turn-helix transcriptional regulator [Acuticoccus kalidii]